MASDYRVIRAHYSDSCSVCGGKIAAGEEVLYRSSPQEIVCPSGACRDAAWGSRFGEVEAEQEAEAYRRKHEEREYREGASAVRQIQAISAPGSAYRERLYLEQELRDYNLGLDG